MELDYASSAEGNAALATGIVGTSLGALNLIGNLANGAGLFGMQQRRNCEDYDHGHRRDYDDYHDSCYRGGGNWSNWGRRGWSTDGHDEEITRHEFKEALAYQNALMAEDMEISELKSEKISDAKDVEVYKQLRSEISAIKNDYDRELAQIHSSLHAQAIQNQANKDSFQLLQERMDTRVAELDGAIGREVATRKANDNLIVTYTNSTFTPKVVMTTTFTGATVESSSAPQITYNPLPCCDCND